MNTFFSKTVYGIKYERSKKTDCRFIVSQKERKLSKFLLSCKIITFLYQKFKKTLIQKLNTEIREHHLKLSTIFWKTSMFSKNIENKIPTLIVQKHQKGLQLTFF